MTQNIEDILDKLRSYNQVDYPILSMSFTIPQDKSLVTVYKRLADQLPPEDHEKVQQDMTYIGSFLTDYHSNHNAQGLALFSGGNHLWEVIVTPFPLKEVISVTHSPNISTIEEVIATYKRYLVVVVDRKRGIFFTLFEDLVEDQGHVEDSSVPQDVKGRDQGYRADKISRHILDHLQRHIELVVQKVDEFSANRIISGVILGGHKEILRRLEDTLPERLKKKVIGKFITELNIPLQQIADESMRVIHKGSV